MFVPAANLHIVEVGAKSPQPGFDVPGTACVEHLHDLGRVFAVAFRLIILA